MKKLIPIIALITIILVFLVVYTSDSKPEKEYKSPIGITPEGAKIYSFYNSGDRIYVVHYQNTVVVTVAH